MALNPCIEISEEEEKKEIDKAIKSNRELYLIIIKKKNSSPIGYIRINWLDNSYRFGWLRFALGEKRGKGYSKGTLQCLLTYLFKKGVLKGKYEEQYGLNILIGLPALFFQSKDKKSINSVAC